MSWCLKTNKLQILVPWKPCIFYKENLSAPLLGYADKNARFKGVRIKLPIIFFSFFLFLSVFTRSKTESKSSQEY
jgi:hypothetical protein